MTEQTSQLSRIERLEALAETTLLAIEGLAQRQNRTQEQLDQLRQTVEDLSRQQDANAHQIALNAESISELRASILDLRNIVADSVSNQNR